MNSSFLIRARSFSSSTTERPRSLPSESMRYRSPVMRDRYPAAVFITSGWRSLSCLALDTSRK